MKTFHLVAKFDNDQTLQFTLNEDGSVTEDSDADAIRLIRVNRCATVESAVLTMCKYGFHHDWKMLSLKAPVELLQRLHDAANGPFKRGEHPEFEEVVLANEQGKVFNPYDALVSKGKLAIDPGLAELYKVAPEDLKIITFDLGEKPKKKESE